MARAKMEFLSRDEIERIRNTSMKILDKVGIAVHSPSVIEMLVKAGANKSSDGKRILLPESVVTSAVKSAPRSLLLAARDKTWDMKVPSDGRMYLANGGEGVFVKDLITGISRYSNADDVRDFTILANEVPQIDFWWSMVGAIDQPSNIKCLTETKIGLEYCVKHVQAMASSAAEARKMVEMASVLAGDEKALSRRPIFSSVQCPISPLTFEAGLAEAQVELAQAGIPVVAMVAAVAGLTAPASLSGAMAQVNAENLASLTISQVACKGAPWIYSSDTSAGDLKTGSIDYRAMETFLLRAGQGQIGRSYGFPTMVSGIGLEEISLALGSVEEGVPYLAVQMLVDSDFASGLGGIEQAAGASFEQFVLDAWVYEAARKLCRNFDTDEAAMAFETIAAAALDGNFLGKRHTMSHFRKEFSSAEHPEATLGGPKDVRPRGELIKKASLKAKEILNRPKRILVTKDESEQMDRIIKSAR